MYELDEETLKPIKKGGTYLDPEAERRSPRSPTRASDLTRCPGLVCMGEAGASLCPESCAFLGVMTVLMAHV